MSESVDLTPLDEYLASLPVQISDVIPILQRTQAIYGYLPREALQRIADRLHMSLGKVYGVATFYDQFYLEKRGRHTLRLCDGTACHVKDAPGLMEAIRDEYGIGADETTEDGQLTVKIVYCIGSCALAPVAVLDNTVMGRMGREKLLQRVRHCVGSSAKGNP